MDEVQRQAAKGQMSCLVLGASICITYKSYALIVVVLCFAGVDVS
jgi:hypothetical protein